ncbi:hypothetical protein LCGC14_1390000 [marine sediment metagenome]|uniref:Anaphase-promoting complex subunit 4 WD40 domain-containing protein n=1 Tax=marine sediment metagenome TaxID=412755 RepID=A0A0F9K084_9ZZZZ
MVLRGERISNDPDLLDNLQVWAENGYDTRLLHRNIAFPLLNQLSKEGDLTAKKVFKEEIAVRFSSGHETVMNFLLEGKYLEILSKEEFDLVLSEIDFSHVNLNLFLKNAMQNILKSKHAKLILKKILDDVRMSNIFIPFDDIFLEEATDEGFMICGNGNILYYGNFKKELYRYNLRDAVSHYLGEYEDNIDVIGISIDDNLLGLGFFKKDVLILDIKKEKVISHLKTDTKHVRNIKFSSGNKYVLVGMADYDFYKYYLYIWDLSKNKIHNKIIIQSDEMPFDISPDGKHMIFATTAGVIIIEDIESKKILKKIYTNENISHLYYTPDGKRIISGHIYEQISVWDITSGKNILSQNLENFKIEENRWDAYHFSNPLNNSLICIGFGAAKTNKEILVIYNFIKNEIVNVYPTIGEKERGETWHLLTSKDGKVIACYILGGYVKLWMELNTFLNNYFKVNNKVKCLFS